MLFANNVQGVQIVSQQIKSSLQLNQAEVSKRILRIRELTHKTGLSRAYIYDLQAKGLFPASIRLGPNTVGWLEQDVDTWLNQRIAESRSKSSAEGKQ